MSVNRDEFDNVKQQVDATADIVAAELVGLRTHMDERFARVESKLDQHTAILDQHTADLRAYTAQANTAITIGTQAVTQNARFNRAIAAHFGIELPDED